MDSQHPAEKVRFHTCYSIDVGPHIHEIALKDIVDIMLKINAGAYSFEAAKPAARTRIPCLRAGTSPTRRSSFPV